TTYNDVAPKLSMSNYNDDTASVRMINQMEWTRRQLEDMQKMLAASKADKSLIDQTKALDAKALSIEDKLLQRTVADGDLKSFRGPLQPYLKFDWLQAQAGTVGADVSGNSDLGHIDLDVEVFNRLHGHLQAPKQ